jgi:MFS family permease
MEKHHRASFVPLYFVFFLDNFGFSLVFSLFGPLLLDPQFGFLPSEIGVGTRNLYIALLFAVFPLAQLFGAPFIGDLGDHYGRKKCFYVTLMGSVAGYILAAISILTHSYVLLIVSRLINGFVAGNLGLCLAAIADLTPTETSRGRHYGFIAMTAGISWVLAVLSGSYLTDRSIYALFHPAIPYMLTAFLSILALISVAVLFKETHVTRQKKIELKFFRGLHNIATSFYIKEVRWLYVVYFFWVLGWGTTIQWFAPFSIEAFHQSDIVISWALVFFGVAWAVGGSLINWLLLKKLKSSSSARWGLLLTAVGIIIASLSHKFSLFATSYILAALFAGVGMSNLLNLISMAAPASMQGKVMGLSQSTMALSWIVGPICAGLITDVNIKITYYYAASFLVLSLLILMIEGHRRRRKNKKNPFFETH